MHWHSDAGAFTFPGPVTFLGAFTFAGLGKIATPLLSPALPRPLHPTPPHPRG